MISDKAKNCPKCGAPVITLIKCKDCGGMVSPNAVTCPHCGAPLKTMSMENTNSRYYGNRGAYSNSASTYPKPVAKPMIGFFEAIQTCLKKYAIFNGRARRSEFWYFYLFVFIISVCLSTLASLLSVHPYDYISEEEYRAAMLPSNIIRIIFYVASIGLFVPNLSVCIRRLHDVGKSGWFYLLNFIPIIGQIILLIWYVKDSDVEANRYGVSPKYAQ